VKQEVIKLKVLIVCSVSVFLACLLLAQSKTTGTNSFQNVLERAVFSDHERSFTTPEAFHASLNRARVPGGMVTVSGCQTNTPAKSWNPQGQPLGQVLNEIVGVDRNYRWEIQDGAINLLPASGEPLLLQTHVGEFSIKTKSSLDALNQLQQRAEVKEGMSNVQLKGGLAIIMYSRSPTEFSVQFKGGTLRQALNAIAVSSGSDVWDYSEVHCGQRNEVSIRF
jgi:hypothetical protein